MTTPTREHSSSKVHIKEAARYNSQAKQYETNKVERREVIGAILRLMTFRDTDTAIVLDDVGVESSKVIAANTTLGAKQIIVINYGDTKKLAAMRKDAKGTATVVSGDAHHFVHTLPAPTTSFARLYDADFCCCATTILDGGSIQAVIPRMPLDEPSILALTFSGRNNCKHKASDPATHISDVVKATAERHGLRVSSNIFLTKKILYLVVFLCVGCTGVCTRLWTHACRHLPAYAAARYESTISSQCPC